VEIRVRVPSKRFANGFETLVIFVSSRYRYTFEATFTYRTISTLAPVDTFTFVTGDRDIHLITPYL
jgi:hypothetical protein